MTLYAYDLRIDLKCFGAALIGKNFVEESLRQRELEAK